MLCPYCNVQYTPEEPCFCHPRTIGEGAKPYQARPAQDQPEGLATRWERPAQDEQGLYARPQR